METTEAFNLIKEFYNHAWNNLIFIISGAATSMVLIMGIVMPLLLQWTQSKREKKEIQNIKDMANETIGKKITEIENRFNELEKSINLVHGGVYFSQVSSDDKPIVKFFSYLKALECFLKAEHGYNINRTFKFLIKYSMQIENIKDEEIKQKYYEVISLIEKNNINGIYTDRLKDLKEAIKVD
jgi:hypothetical protein